MSVQSTHLIKIIEIVLNKKIMSTRFEPNIKKNYSIPLQNFHTHYRILYIKFGTLIFIFKKREYPSLKREKENLKKTIDFFFKF